MTSADGRAHIVFNGEIYNFRQLRQDLEAQGVSFCSQGDTEVLLALYRRYGRAMLGKLNGVFAFALWDEDRRELFCARDPMGVKPFYYTQAEGRFLCASEVKVLLQCPGVSARIDPLALACHLAYLWCPHPRSAFRNIWKLPPGHFMVVNAEGHIQEQGAYWAWSSREEAGASQAERIAAFGSTLQQSVERQLVSDVPVGLFLSGGLDSSAIAQAYRTAQPGAPIHAFCSVTSQGDGADPDWPYAQQVAEAQGLQLHPVPVDTLDFDAWARILWHLEEPQADPAIYHVDLIARQARSMGLKVLLSGAGGDDLLTGYRRHQVLGWEGLRTAIPLPLRQLATWAGEHLPVRPAELRRLRKGLEGFDQATDERIATLFEWLPAAAVHRILALETGGDFRETLLGPLRALSPDIPPINRVLFAETLGFLPDHNLNYVDKLTMAHGVEARVPLLDLELVHLANHLPVRDKLRGTTTKWILRQAMAAKLPPSILHRPKTGFGAPLRTWLAGPMRAGMDDWLETACRTHPDWFHPHAVRSLWKDTLEGRADGSYALWTITTLTQWAAAFHVS